jgi:hypothetical protein
MVITEIFKSIQGEGTRASLPRVFVRLKRLTQEASMRIVRAAK